MHYNFIKNIYSFLICVLKSLNFKYIWYNIYNYVLLVLDVIAVQYAAYRVIHIKPFIYYTFMLENNLGQRHLFHLRSVVLIVAYLGLVIEYNNLFLIQIYNIDIIY